MSSLHSFAFGLVALASVAAPAAAQAPGRAVILSVRGGGYSALSNLNSAGTLDTKTGFNVGAGVGVGLSRYVVFRVDGTLGRDELRLNGVDSGVHLNKYLYTGAVQFQYPTSGGLTPYALVGAGGITLHEENTTGLNETKAVGVVGAGLRYTLGSSRWGIMTEGLGYGYKTTDLRGRLAGLDKNQFDLAWSAGLSYSIGR